MMRRAAVPGSRSFTEKSPTHGGLRCLGSAQQQDQNDEWSWYPDEPEKNWHVISFRISISIAVTGDELWIPMCRRGGRRLRSRPARAEGTDQQRKPSTRRRAARQPFGCIRSVFAWVTTSLTRLSASASTETSGVGRNHHHLDGRPVQIAAVLETGSEQPSHLAARIGGILLASGGRIIGAQQRIDIAVHRTAAVVRRWPPCVAPEGTPADYQVFGRRGEQHAPRTDARPPMLESRVRCRGITLRFMQADPFCSQPTGKVTADS